MNIGDLLLMVILGFLFFKGLHWLNSKKLGDPDDDDDELT